MITVEVFFDENNEFEKTKRVFCSVYPRLGFLVVQMGPIRGSKGHPQILLQFSVVFVKTK